jgi:imidazolonepropionase-like amidohydrolase
MLLIGFVFCLAAATPARSDTIAIEHTTVLPMHRDTALADHTVIVAGDRIAWIGRSDMARVPRNAQRVDGRGAYLIPGLADMHVHIAGAEDLRQFVAAGVTTVRNMRGTPEHLMWRERVAKGTLVGPTIFTSGPSIGRGDSRFVTLNTPDDARTLVRDQVRAGYDMIKVLNGVSVPVYQSLLHAARAARIPVVGHVVSDVGLERTLAAGQVSLEHAYSLRHRSRIASLFGDDQSDLDADARAVARAGAWVGTITSSRDGQCNTRETRVFRRIAALRRAGVRLLAGSDAGIGPVRPGEALHCELATLVASGFTPYQALATATVNAGAFARMHLGRTRVPFGTVTVGSRADLLLLAADPRLDIRSVARLRGVVLRGIWRPARSGN